MSRYIDAEKADDVIETELGVYDTTELKEMLKYFPTEDVAPVVHAYWKWYNDETGWIDWKGPACEDKSGWRCSHCKTRLEDMFWALMG